MQLSSNDQKALSEEPLLVLFWGRFPSVCEDTTAAPVLFSCAD